jgi:hypothetical protein
MFDKGVWGKLDGIQRSCVNVNKQGYKGKITANKKCPDCSYGCEGSCSNKCAGCSGICKNTAN